MTIEVKIPDIGDFSDVPIVEIMVKPGDAVKPEDVLLTLESDKATLDVPSPAAGTVASVSVAVGDKVSEGSVILLLDAATAAPAPTPPKTTISAPPAPASAPAGVAEVRVPDIGDFKDVPVIEIMVKPGDTVKPEDPLIMLESDKATMDVPAPLGGVVQDLRVKVGDKVSEGLRDPAADDGGAGWPGHDGRAAERAAAAGVARCGGLTGCRRRHR